MSATLLARLHACAVCTHCTRGSQVMAYLNGCLVPRVFNIFTLLVKFLSCGLCVASGLPVGPEGPLIHIGAALGSAISQVRAARGRAPCLSRAVQLQQRRLDSPSTERLQLAQCRAACPLMWRSSSRSMCCVCVPSRVWLRSMPMADLA
eukprot:355754-Chlamydomonas_euryale.AAC.12